MSREMNAFKFSVLKLATSFTYRDNERSGKQMAVRDHKGTWGSQPPDIHALE